MKASAVPTYTYDYSPALADEELVRWRSHSDTMKKCASVLPVRIFFASCFPCNFFASSCCLVVGCSSFEHLLISYPPAPSGIRFCSRVYSYVFTHYTDAVSPFAVPGLREEGLTSRRLTIGAGVFLAAFYGLYKYYRIMHPNKGVWMCVLAEHGLVRVDLHHRLCRSHGEDARQLSWGQKNTDAIEDLVYRTEIDKARRLVEETYELH